MTTNASAHFVLIGCRIILRQQRTSGGAGDGDEGRDVPLIRWKERRVEVQRNTCNPLTSYSHPKQRRYLQ